MMIENVDHLLVAEKSWEQELLRLTAVELPWALPFQVWPGPRRRSKGKLSFLGCMGEPVQLVEFGAITPRDATLWEINEDQKISNIQFATEQAEIPLFRESGSLRGNVAIAHDASAWRLRHLGKSGFPRHGCFSYDLLAAGVFLSPRHCVLGRRFIVHNPSSKALTILVESDQDWLVAGPPNFRVPPGAWGSIQLQLLLKRLDEGDHYGTVCLKTHRETIKARVHVAVRSGSSRAVLLRPKADLVIATLHDSVPIAMEFAVEGSETVEGAVLDPLHRLRRPFRCIVQGGHAQATVTLPTSELIKSIYTTWPLRILVYCTNGIVEQVLLVRLVRQLSFEPAMPIVSPGKNVSVRVQRYDGEPLQLHLEEFPSELQASLEGPCLVIRCQNQSAGRGSIQWIRLRDEISGERAMLPALFLGAQ